MSLNLRTLLDKLTTGTAAPTQDAVSAWLEKHVPVLESKARAVFAPPVTVPEVYDLIGAVVTAATDGLTILPGTDRKAVVKTVVKYLVKTYAVGRFGFALGFLLSDAVIDGVIESIYQLLFKAQPAPETPAPPAPPVTDALTYTDAPPAGVPAVVGGSLADQINQN